MLTEPVKYGENGWSGGSESHRVTEVGQPNISRSLAVVHGTSSPQGQN